MFRRGGVAARTLFLRRNVGGASLLGSLGGGLCDRDFWLSSCARRPRRFPTPNWKQAACPRRSVNGGRPSSLVTVASRYQLRYQAPIFARHYSVISLPAPRRPDCSLHVLFGVVHELHVFTGSCKGIVNVGAPAE
jgi:hypothetical protein